MTASGVKFLQDEESPHEADRSYIAPEKGIDDLSKNETTNAKSWYEVGMPSLAFAGVQLSWAVLIGHATAHLRKLGLSDRAVGLAWLAGPMTGTLVQPIVGALSDDCTSRLGRRRPFMIGGSILTCAGLVVFSQAGEIARLLGDPVNPTGGGSRTGLAIGILSFWMVDFAVNVLQTPTRALLADVVPKGQLSIGNAFFAVANGVGKGIGYALGAFCPSIREAFGAAGGIVVVLTWLTCVGVKEQQGTERTTGSAWKTASDTVGRSIRATQTMPRGVGRIFVVQWLTYLGLMYLFIYGCDWVGRDVFGGNGDAAPGSAAHARFEAGVRFGNVGLLCMAVISMMVAPWTPRAVRAIGLRRVWGGSLLLMGVAFLAAPVAGKAAAAAMFACSSLAVCCAFTLPWALVSACVSGEDRGLHLATFNLSQATPGLVASTTGGLLVHAARGRLEAIMVCVGVCGVCAAVAVAFVDGAVRDGAAEHDGVVGERRSDYIAPEAGKLSEG